MDQNFWANHPEPQGVLAAVGVRQRPSSCPWREKSEGGGKWGIIGPLAAPQLPISDEKTLEGKNMTRYDISLIDTAPAKRLNQSELSLGTHQAITSLDSLWLKLIGPEN